MPLERPTPRKRPRQARSKLLVDSLLEATARILRADGWDALTTNRVAREAGVSVGSLYQYFPNKEALVAGLLECWSEEVLAWAADLFLDVATAPVDAAIARMVRASLELGREDAILHRVLLAQLPHEGLRAAFEQLERRVMEHLAEWIAARRAELHVEDPSLTAFVLVTALDAAVDKAVMTRPELLDSPRFARELERLVAGYLGPNATRA